jgi:hypothetical protein
MMMTINRVSHVSKQQSFKPFKPAGVIPMQRQSNADRRFRGKAHVHRHVASTAPVVDDPKRS